MNKPIIGFDLETSSAVPISVGSYRYISDPSTRALMFAYQPVGAASGPKLWLEGDPIPNDFIQHVHSGAFFSGWNVNLFDRLGYQTLLVERWGFPPIEDDNWLDTMHRAAMANLPRSLDGCAKAINMDFQEGLKDKAAIGRITDANRTPIPYLVADILAGSIPTEPTKAKLYKTWEAGAQAVLDSLVNDLQWLANRCVQDVELESGILARLPEWPEISPWLAMPHVDRRINDRGILLDVPMLQGLVKAASAETARLNEQMDKLTGGKVAQATQVEALKHWLVDRGIELPRTDEKKLIEKDEDDNPEVEVEEEVEKSRKSEWKLRKNDIADLIAREFTPEDCRLALEIRAEVSKVSTRKFNTMLAQMSDDGRARGVIKLGGAQQTMRFASQGANYYNTVRDVFGNPDEVAEAHGLNVKADHDAVMRHQNEWLQEAIEVARSGDNEVIRKLYAKERKDAQGRPQKAGVMTWISRMTRRTIAAQDGHMLLNGDYSQIESRVTDWLAQQTNMLEAYFRKQDVYKITAAGIYGTSPDALTKTMRQAGKVSKLALSFGGGINALLSMGYNYGLLMTEEVGAPIVKAFRELNEAVRRYWYATDDAAANAIRHPGKSFSGATP